VFATADSEQGIEVLQKIPNIQVFNHSEHGYVEKIQASSGHRVDVSIQLIIEICNFSSWYGIVVGTH